MTMQPARRPPQPARATITLIDTSGLVWALAGDRGAEQPLAVTAEAVVDAVAARGAFEGRGIFVLDGSAYRRTAGHIDPIYKAQREPRPDVVQNALDALPRQLPIAIAARRESLPPTPSDAMIDERLPDRRSTARVGERDQAGFDWRVFHEPAIEADDAIVAIAAWCAQRGIAVHVLSTDRDLMQILRGNDDLWIDLRAWLSDRESAQRVHRHILHGEMTATTSVGSAVRRLAIDRRGAQRIWRSTPERIPEILALTGDRCDHLDGVPGLGRHVAGRLLQRYGSLRGLLRQSRQRAAPGAGFQNQARGTGHTGQRVSRRMAQASRLHDERLVRILSVERSIRRNHALLRHCMHARAVRAWCNEHLGIGTHPSQDRASPDVDTNRIETTTGTGDIRQPSCCDHTSATTEAHESR